MAILYFTSKASNRLMVSVVLDKRSLIEVTSCIVIIPTFLIWMFNRPVLSLVVVGNMIFTLFRAFQIKGIVFITLDALGQILLALKPVCLFSQGRKHTNFSLETANHKISMQMNFHFVSTKAFISYIV
jgi:hypothetical protein